MILPGTLGHPDMGHHYKHTCKSVFRGADNCGLGRNPTMSRIWTWSPIITLPCLRTPHLLLLDHLRTTLVVYATSKDASLHHIQPHDFQIPFKNAVRRPEKLDLITACLDAIQALRHWSLNPNNPLIRFGNRPELARPGMYMVTSGSHYQFQAWDQSHTRSCEIWMWSENLAIAESTPRYVTLDLEYMTYQLMRVYRDCKYGGYILTFPNRDVSLHGHYESVSLLLDVPEPGRSIWPWESLGGAPRNSTSK